MKILVTGAGGFLGSNLVEALLRSTSDEVVAVSSQKERLLTVYSNVLSRFSVIDRTAINTVAWNDIDIIVNAAFPRNLDGVEMAKGLDFTADLFQRAAAGGAKAIINISSQSVYNQKREIPAFEGMQVDLETKYAIGKYAVELMTDRLCSQMHHVNLRMASLIGIGFDQRITNKFVAQAQKGNNLKIFGGKQCFGFLDVRDAVSAIIGVIHSDFSKWDTTYNLGTEKYYTLEEIAACVCRLSNEYCENGITYEMEESDIFQNSSLDCSRFYNTFNWKPDYDLEDTIKWLFLMR